MNESDMVESDEPSGDDPREERVRKWLYTFEDGERMGVLEFVANARDAVVTALEALDAVKKDRDEWKLSHEHRRQRVADAIATLRLTTRLRPGCNNIGDAVNDVCGDLSIVRAERDELREALGGLVEDIDAANNITRGVSELVVPSPTRALVASEGRQAPAERMEEQAVHQDLLVKATDPSPEERGMAEQLVSWITRYRPSKQGMEGTIARALHNHAYIQCAENERLRDKIAQLEARPESSLTLFGRPVQREWLVDYATSIAKEALEKVLQERDKNHAEARDDSAQAAFKFIADTLEKRARHLRDEDNRHGLGFQKEAAQTLEKEAAGIRGLLQQHLEEQKTQKQ